MSKCWSTIVLFIVTHCLLCAEPSKMISDSPFLPPGYNKQKPSNLPNRVTQTNGPLSKDFEFRGIVQLNNVYQFSLFKKSENKAYWISENSSENGISIRDFDLDSMRITVSANGQSEQLTLMTASENPLPVAASPQTLPNVIKPTQPIPTQSKSAPVRRTIPRRRVILPKK